MLQVYTLRSKIASLFLKFTKKNIRINHLFTILYISSYANYEKSIKSV